jgi:hypothetical protein
VAEIRHWVFRAGRDQAAELDNGFARNYAWSTKTSYIDTPSGLPTGVSVRNGGVGLVCGGLGTGSLITSMTEEQAQSDKNRTQLPGGTFHSCVTVVQMPIPQVEHTPVNRLSILVR